MGRRLIQIIGSSRWRGKESYALDLSTEFSGRGWSVTAYTRDAKAVDRNFEQAHIDLRHAPLRGPVDWTSIQVLKNDFKDEAPGAVVHVHRYRDAFTVLVAKRLARRPDIKVVATRHKVKKGKNSWLFRWIYRSVDAHIFVSYLAKQRFLSAWRHKRIPIDPQRIFVVHNSIRYPQAPLVPEPAKGAKTGLFHGPLIPGKGLETLIDALSHLKGKKTRIMIAGGGDPDYIDTLRRRAMTRGVMDMIDWKKHTDNPHELIDRCHFGVQPSLFPEAFCLPNIEYMAHGRPVITTDNGAQPEYITNLEEGILVSPADASVLGEALLKMATEDEERRRMGENAYRKFATQMAWNIFADKIEKAYG